MSWFDGMTPEDLPGDLQLVARECGMDVAFKLAEKLGGIHIYIRPLKSLLVKKKKEFVIKNFNGANHKELAVAIGCTERYIYQIMGSKE